MCSAAGQAADQKAIYAEMQGVELSYRDKNIVTPYILKAPQGLRLVGIRTGETRFPYAWLALERENPNSADGVFLVGNTASWELTCAQTEELLNKERTSTRVAQFLRTRCNK
jgi:hypothetical protein